VAATGSRTRLGIVGAGNIGGAMAARLCARGWPVVVHDIDPAREAEAAALGAKVASDAATVAMACDVLIVVVVDAAQTREVLFGHEGGGSEGMGAGGRAGAPSARRAAVQGLRPGQLVMLCPTIAPEDVAGVGEGLARIGVHTLEAPTSGGPQRARDGSMSLMLAGEAALIERHAAWLADVAAARFHVGERLGDAARTKLVNNLLATINLAGAAEALALAQRLGLDASRTLDVIERSSGQSWIASDRLRRALAGDAVPRAHVGLLAKDSALALAMAHRAGCEVPVGAAAAAVFAAARAEGWAGEDDASLWRRALGEAPPGPHWPRPGRSN
jgi:3-hydroxyisobutyrate dehydrogenase-like beta-hydroxyacid dehydrogenase